MRILFLFNVTAYGLDGSTSSIFRLTPNENVCFIPPTINGGSSSGTLGSGVFSSALSIFNGFFPPAESLTLGAKFGYVCVTIILVDLLIIVFLAFGMKSFPNIALWIILFLDFLIIGYFVGISYIPMSFFLFIVLLVAIFTILKLKGGS
jgi:hypothetical protein